MNTSKAGKAATDRPTRTLVRVTVALMGALVALAPGIAGAATPSADLGPCLCGTTRTLNPGQYLLSQDGRFKLAMQGDGNLVIYAGTKPLWDSQTASPGARAVLQSTDGNLVIYSPSGKALWSAAVPKSPTDTLQMQNDGNLVVYSDSGAALWGTMSAVEPHGATLTSNPGVPGQCTWWVEQLFHAYTGAFINTLGVPGATSGNALDWAYNASRRGWAVGSVPRIGSIAVFRPGAAGAGAVGHVAWVTQVYPSRNSIVISEMNYKGPGVVDTRTVSPAFGVSGLQFIYTNP